MKEKFIMLQKTKRGASFTAKRIALDAVFTALYLVLSISSLNVSSYFKFTFDGIAIIMCAFMFGAVDAFFVAVAGSFLSQLLTYGMSITTPIWMASAIARAAICGIVAQAKKFDVKTWEIAVTVIASSIVVTLVNTLAMYLDALIVGYLSQNYLRDTVYGFLGWRLLSGVLTAALYAAVTPPLLYAMRRAKIAKLPRTGIAKDCACADCSDGSGGDSDRGGCSAHDGDVK